MQGAPTLVSSVVSQGTLSFDGSEIAFQSKKADAGFLLTFDQHFDIPGLRVLEFEKKTTVSSGGKDLDVSIIQFKCEDGSKLEITANQPVEVLRFELTFDDDSKIILWKAMSQFR